MSSTGGEEKVGTFVTRFTKMDESTRTLLLSRLEAMPIHSEMADQTRLPQWMSYWLYRLLPPGVSIGRESLIKHRELEAPDFEGPLRDLAILLRDEIKRMIAEGQIAVHRSWESQAPEARGSYHIECRYDFVLGMTLIELGLHSRDPNWGSLILTCSIGRVDTDRFLCWRVKWD